MTDDKWRQVVSHVLDRLKRVPRFEAEHDQFFKHFELIEEDGYDFLRRRDHGKEKCFEYHLESRDSLRVLVFSRLEPLA